MKYILLLNNETPIELSISFMNQDSAICYIAQYLIMIECLPASYEERRSSKLQRAQQEKVDELVRE